MWKSRAHTRQASTESALAPGGVRPLMVAADRGSLEADQGPGSRSTRTSLPKSSRLSFAPEWRTAPTVLQIPRVLAEGTLSWLRGSILQSFIEMDRGLEILFTGSSMSVHGVFVLLVEAGGLAGYRFRDGGLGAMNERLEWIPQGRRCRRSRQVEKFLFRLSISVLRGCLDLN